MLIVTTDVDDAHTTATWTRSDANHAIHDAYHDKNACNR